MDRKIVIICVDGMGPDCLECAETPNIDRMAREGVYVVGECVIPSVTNVNNVSIITGCPPRVHGITANYWIDRATGRETYMDSPEFLLCETVLERAQRKGMSTCLLTAKKKLLGLLDAGATWAVAAEDPDEETIGKVGPAQDIYTAEINLWLFRALRMILREKKPDLAYCSTTDWTMHKYAPDEEVSINHIQGIDAILGEILDENPDLEVYLTADHGMSAKTRGVDLEEVLSSCRFGIRSRAIPVIKDRYVAHHQNLGGASYVYLEDRELAGKAMAALLDTPGIEAAYENGDAAREFGLMPDRIGDILVLADADTVFGTFEEGYADVLVRSHGSLHERAVPIIVYGTSGGRDFRRNMDIVANLGID